VATERAARYDGHADWYDEQFAGNAGGEEAGFIRHHLGAGDGAVCLDVACGTGIMAATVATAGWRPVGLDLSADQLRLARPRLAATVRADAGRLPVRSGVAGAAVLAFADTDIEDLAEVAAEVARVLRPGGRFVIFINHPLFQTPSSGWIDDHVLDPPEQYWRIGPYLPESVSIEEVDSGVRLPFFHRPLGRYVNALAERGLFITRMVEPAPPPGFLARAPQYVDAATIPRLLLLRAERR